MRPTTMITTKAIFSLLCVSLPTSEAISQFSRLPTNRTSEVRQKIGNLELEQALRAALNSPGDTITIDIWGQVSAGFLKLLSASAQGKFEVQIKRVADGYEVYMAQGQSGAIGIEPFPGIEAKAELGMGQKVIFKFDSLEQLANDIKTMAIAAVVKVKNAMEQAKRLVNATRATFAQTEQAYWSAVQQLNLGRTTQKTLYDSYVAAGHVLNSFSGALTRARNSFNHASHQLRRVEQQVNSAPKFLRGMLRGMLRGAQAAANGARNALSQAQRSYDDALRKYNSAHDQWKAATNRLGQLINNEVNTRVAKASAQARHFEALTAEKAVVYAFNRAANRLYATESKVSGGGTLSAALKIPGVDLNNLGLGASASLELSSTIRTELPTSSTPTRMLVTTALKTSASANAGAFVGVGGGIENTISIQGSFVKPAKQKFRFEDVKTTILLDSKFQGQVGIGLAGVYGAGRTQRLEMNRAQWSQALSRVPQLLKKPSAKNLLLALDRVNMTYTEQDRWIAGATAKIGGEIMGWGLSAGGGVMWEDRGDEFKTIINAGQIVRAMTNPTTWKNVTTDMRLLARKRWIARNKSPHRETTSLLTKLESRGLGRACPGAAGPRLCTKLMPALTHECRDHEGRRYDRAASTWARTSIKQGCCSKTGTTATRTPSPSCSSATCRGCTLTCVNASGGACARSSRAWMSCKKLPWMSCATARALSSTITASSAPCSARSSRTTCVTKSVGWIASAAITRGSRRSRATHS